MGPANVPRPGAWGDAVEECFVAEGLFGAGDSAMLVPSEYLEVRGKGWAERSVPGPLTASGAELDRGRRRVRVAYLEAANAGKGGLAEGEPTLQRCQACWSYVAAAPAFVVSARPHRSSQVDEAPETVLVCGWASDYIMEASADREERGRR